MGKEVGVPGAANKDPKTGQAEGERKGRGEGGGGSMLSWEVYSYGRDAGS